MADNATITNLVIRTTMDNTGAKKGADETVKDVKRVGNSIKKQTAVFGKFSKSIARIAQYRAIRGVIKGISNAFREGLGNLYAWSKELNGHYADSVDRAKNALLGIKNGLAVMVAPIIEMAVPALEKLSDTFIKTANAVSRFIAILRGQSTYTKVQTGNMNKYAASVKAANRTLLAFDEINRLNGEGGGGGESQDTNTMFSEEDVGAYSKLDNQIKKFGDKIKEHLREIGAVTGISAIGLGLYLLFSGANIGLGLSMAISGLAMTYAATSENWGAPSAQLLSELRSLETALGAFSFAIGAYLVFSGADIPRGLAMLTAGSVGISAGASNPSEDDPVSKVRSVIDTLTGIVSAAALVVGAVLTFLGGGVNPVGLKLMAVGAAATFGRMAANPNATIDALKNFGASALTVLAGLGGVIGILLCMTGVGLPIGLPLLYASYKGAVKAWSLNDNPITRWVKRMMDGIIDIINRGIDEINKILPDKWDIPHLKKAAAASESGSTAYDSIVAPMASGGIADNGQLFLAREAGPELVGTIGGQSAVVNNDQIVSAVSTGVYNAVVSAMKEGNTAVEVYLDGQQIANDTYPYMKRLENRYGRSYAR